MSFETARSVVLNTVPEQNTEMVQGDDETYRAFIEVYNPSTEEFDPFDLTGSTAYFTIRHKYTDEILFETDSSTGTITFVDAVNGVLVTTISNAITRNIPVGVHKYDIQINDTLGQKRTALLGDIRCVLDSTRS